MSEITTEQVTEANDWFLNKRSAALEACNVMPQKTADEMRKKIKAMEQFNVLDAQHEKILSQTQQVQTIEGSGFVMKNTAKPVAPPQGEKPVFYVNPDVAGAIAQYRSENTDLSKKVGSMSREQLESEYFLKLMKRDGYEPGTNTAQDIAKYREDHPSLNKRAEVMPRERLENDYVLGVMKKNGFDPAGHKYKEFLNRPENAALKKEAENLVSHIRNPQVRERVMYREKAPSVLKAKGLKI